jgi:sporulation protein YlmC with PRC-barrel domain
MRLELGTKIRCSDGGVRELADVVLESGTVRVTHLVVRQPKQPESGRLVPMQLVEDGDRGERVSLRCSAEELDRLEPVREFAYLPAGEQPEEDPEWEIGVQDVSPAPQLEPTSYGEYGVDVGGYVGIAYDRVPKGEIELRHASDVYSADRHHLGSVKGVELDAEERVTHLLLERGHIWWRREISVPIDAVSKFETDVVTLGATKQEVEAFPGGKRR